MQLRELESLCKSGLQQLGNQGSIFRGCMESLFGSPAEYGRRYAGHPKRDRNFDNLQGWP